jgi:ABC-type Na+ efflux pump permease subunit
MDFMDLVFAEKKKIGQIAGLFGALCTLVIMQISPSHAGIVNPNNATNAVGTLAGVATGALVGGAVIGSLGGPAGAAAVSAGAVTGAVVVAITYTAVTQSIKNPTAAVQTVRSLIPFTGPIYTATNPTQTINGMKNFWNYLFN